MKFGKCACLSFAKVSPSTFGHLLLTKREAATAGMSRHLLHGRFKRRLKKRQRRKSVSHIPRSQRSSRRCYAPPYRSPSSSSSSVIWPMSPSPSLSKIERIKVRGGREMVAAKRRRPDLDTKAASPPPAGASTSRISRALLVRARAAVSVRACVLAGTSLVRCTNDVELVGGSCWGRNNFSLFLPSCSQASRDGCHNRVTTLIHTTTWISGVWGTLAEKGE